MRVAIVTQGFETGGGVPAIARWLREGLLQAGHEVHVHDLAASRRDKQSRRALSPSTCRSEPRAEASRTDDGLFRRGATWVEFESQRNRLRVELTKALNGHDLFQVVAGGPALALAVNQATPPKALQVATTLLMELPPRLPEMQPIDRVVKALSMRSLHRLEVRALRAMDHALVENRFIKKWVLDQRQPNVTFAPPGIDTDLFSPLGAWDPARPIAFGRLGDSRKVLAGKGPPVSALARRLDQNAVGNRIDVRQDVPKQELAGLLASSSVFLQSTLEEGVGLAGLEAMACGVPVVATRTVGSWRTFGTGRTGFCWGLGPGAAGQLAKGLALVVKPTDGGRMSRNAVRTVSRCCDSTAALARFLVVYASLLGREKA